MPQLNRNRHGAVAAVDRRRVQIADHSVTFERYTELMHNHQQIVLCRFIAQPDVTQSVWRRAASALACGRVVKANSANPQLFELVDYCGQQQFCTRCYASAQAHAVAVQLAGTPSLVGSRLLHVIFTTPRPYVVEDEVRWTSNAANAMHNIVDAITLWRRRKGEGYQVAAYNMGLHAKASDETGLLWPHVHLGIAVNPLCDFAGPDGLVPRLTSAFADAIPDATCPTVIHENLGIIQPDRKCRLGRKHVPLTRTHKLMEYTARSSEADDTPQSIARRDQLFRSIGLVTSHIRSRRASDGSKLAKARLPHRFPPDQLGNTQTYVFPFDGEPYAINPAQLSQVEKRLHDDAASLLQDLRPND